MILKKPCKFCNKVSDITSEIDLGKSGKILIFACGHSYIEESLSQVISVIAESKEEHKKTLFEELESATPEFCETHGRKCIKTLTSKSGKHIFPYQAAGVIAATKANAKFIFADEMGLGKTVQGLATIKLNQEKLLPAVFLCKSIAKTNWLWETMDWLELPAQVITSSSETPWDMFRIHILSLDMINRIEKMFKLSEIKDKFKCDSCGSEKVRERNEEVEEFCKVTKGFECNKCDVPHIHQRQCGGKLILQSSFQSLTGGQGKSLKDQNKKAWFGILSRCKTLIIDESHLLKNPESQRSKTVVKLSANIPHILPMSGTLIKNSAVEYFVPLNIIKPEKFWRYESFCHNYVRKDLVQSVTGAYVEKYTGLKDPEYFKNITKDYMIRRTTDEVLPELPKLWKQNKYVELEEAFKEIYEKSEENFAEWFDNASAIELRTNLLAQLALLRHQTSLAKIDYTISLVEEFLISNGRKIAIFTHHIDSREFLIERMDKFFLEVGLPPVFVLGTGSNVQDEIEKFRLSEQRVIVLSTLSHGESINLQFMNDSILHERQWNPANENQAISGRFRRIGQEAPHITCMIPVALGTIDEFFVEIGERKDNIGKEIDLGEIVTSESFVNELANKIAERGRRKWKL